MKPFGCKNYGSIPHLPNSRLGPSDRSIGAGQARICTEVARDRRDLIIVTEKLDGSNVGIGRIGDEIIALGRAGYLADTSPYEQHKLFAAWVRKREGFWREALLPGQRLVGEWLAQAHGTRYSLPHGPFVAFDVIDEKNLRLPHSVFLACSQEMGIPTPKVLHIGGPLSVVDAMMLHGVGDHGLLDEPEGAVWRVEREEKFDFMAKFVRPEKVDGRYLFGDPVWNWTMEAAA